MTDRPLARAFVPGHVTGLFTVHRTDDPHTTGSRGAGFTLADGVTVSVRPTEETTVLIDDSETTVEPVSRVLDALGAKGTVEVQTDLPVGTGFGLSGGMALGTALAANEQFDLGHSENELIRVAHVADVESGTGLGDVVAQARGGIVLRLEPGVSPHGQLDGIPGRGRIEFLALGELSTPAVLTEHPERITRAGTSALESLFETPTKDRFMRASAEFSAEVGLETPAVESILDAVEATGETASMAMLGETVFAFGRGLSEAGYDPQVSAIDPCGARILE
ncbi:MAG: pantoate kinase [Halodesulfurarchaeum sp.]